MKNKLVLISTHYSNKLLSKFANKSKACLVLSFDSSTRPISGDCIRRRKEVLDWIFQQIDLATLTHTLDISDIHEINICIDYNIGHSGENLSSLEDIVKKINTHPKVELCFVKDKEILLEVLKTIKIPVKLLLIGEGNVNTSIIDLCANKTCKPSTATEAVTTYGFMGKKAISNIRDFDSTAASRTSPLLKNTLYSSKNYATANEKQPFPELAEKKSSCCQRLSCVIL